VNLFGESGTGELEILKVSPLFVRRSLLYFTPRQKGET